MADEPFATNVLLFGRMLRDVGLPVPHARLLDALQSLRLIDIGNRHDVRTLLRSLLVHRHEDVPLFDQAFTLFFRRHQSPESDLMLFSLGERPHVIARPLPGAAVAIEFEDVSAERSPSTTRAVSAYSAAALSKTKDFAEFSPQELAEARRVLSRMQWRVADRRTQRWQRAPAGALDLRPLLRRSLTRGEMFALTYRQRRRAPRPVVFIADVSGSMERYSRILIQFMYGIARHWRRVDAFVFSTSLTRLTPRSGAHAADHAVNRALRDVADLGGGTRIGDALRTFNTQWARRVMRPGPVVLLVSDGWDRGEPAMLSRELARVQRSCHRLIWLNPLIGTANYEPLTRGMQAALPYIDDFLPVHNLASLEHLAGHLAAL